MTAIATNGTTDTPALTTTNDAVADAPSELSRAEQRRVVQQHIKDWKEARYSAEVSHRVQRKIGAGPEGLAPILKRIEDCEKAIDELHVVEAELV